MMWCGWKDCPYSRRGFEEQEIGIPTVDRFVASKAEGDKVFVDVPTAVRAILDVVELQAIVTAVSTELALAIIPIENSLSHVVGDLQPTLSLDMVRTVTRHLRLALPGCTLHHGR